MQAITIFPCAIDSPVRDGGITDHGGATVQQRGQPGSRLGLETESSPKAAYEAEMVPRDSC